MSESNKITFKLFTRPHSHLQPVLNSTAPTMEKAIASFRSWYKKYGVNCDTMLTFVVVPVDEKGNSDWSKANGWDTTGGGDNLTTRYYPEKKS
ncbi:MULTISPECIES: hypothetical protein [Vibrio]|uniref:Uncharacterized protein n=2 Tax=Vibrio TaxID=662 RepID=A0A9X0RDA6_VIBME|nr:MULTISPECIES: hypothetical protein [Vibrio]MCA2474663.1 hypothetical protein [Vibrio alginolyticus]TVN04755.1 hypothetical protein FPV63_11170 [Vibrio cholerae]EGR2217420.1 hypothetical protein [Vibrio parahaemolyticus]EGR2855100.1 hypothetical protein [Vibrio parahaemolyticus]EGR2988501.1 hypothetical protein [Vibrio parahaemolyticus]